MLFLNLFWVVFITLMNAFVFLKLWGWFVPPLGASAIGYAHSVGLCTLAAFVVTGMNSGSTFAALQADEEDMLRHSVKHHATAWVMCLTVGYIAFLQGLS
jgi:hypothetical protein